MKTWFTLRLSAENTGFKKNTAVLFCIALLFFYSYAFAQIDSSAVSDSSSGVKIESAPAGDQDTVSEPADRDTNEGIESSDSTDADSGDVETDKGAGNNKNTAGIISNKQATGNKAVKKETGSAITIIKESVPAHTDGLLPITDGNYKYKRIPEIILQNIKYETVSDSSAGDTSIGETEKDSSEEGSMVDTIVLIVLAVLIVGVVVLYKLRSRKSDGKVLRRLPGS